jgi:hypothetical protein
VHAFLATYKQFRSDFLLEIVNLPGQRGLGQVQAGGCVSSIQCFGDRYKIAYVA